MKKETNKLLSTWIDLDPDVLDKQNENRFYDLVFTCLKNREFIDEDDIYKELYHKKKWEEKYKEDFAKKYAIAFENIFGFIEYLKEKQGINLYNSF